MTKSDDVSNSKEVTEHILKLEPTIGLIVNELRQIILSTDTEIGERIKWNNPSFFYLGEMKPFNPKEYKRDIIVMNLFKGKIMLVFPSGAKINNSSKLLEGKYADGRRLITFKDLDDVKSKAKALQVIILDWLKLVEK
jgi:hypothetical protein